MQVTEHIHALEIPFKIPFSPEKMIDRTVYSYLILGEKVTLIDSGVSGAEAIIFDYLRKIGRDPKEISMMVLSHSHPDHLGAAKTIKEATGCLVAAHPNEIAWIEETEKQFKERPVPGFRALVGGSVAVDRPLRDGEIMTIEEGLDFKVMHTPGHSSGSISLFVEQEETLFTGDALPFPGDLPIYEDISGCLASIRKIKSQAGVKVLLSSWEPPIRGQERIIARIEKSVAYLRKIHNAVIAAKGNEDRDVMELCRKVVNSLGLPPLAANPLVAKSLVSSFATMAEEELFKT